ncbi:MAG: hypothetical protein Q8904_00360 [Bacteroidota bacterium]|nr:hypothetical protein [Bacteroidota bacterium]
MNNIIKKNPNLFSFFKLVLLVIVVTYFASNFFMDKSKASMVEVFFDNKPNYNFISNLKGNTFNSVNLLSSYQVNSGSNDYSNTSNNFKNLNSRTYTYSKAYKKLCRETQQNNIQVVNFSDLTKISPTSHQNDNSNQPVSTFPNLAINTNVRKVFSSTTKQDNTGEKKNPNDVISLNSDLLIANNNSEVNISDNVTYQQIGVDPSGDPTTDPIPIGDGYSFLLMLVIGYTLFKVKK